MKNLIYMLLVVLILVPALPRNAGALNLPDPMTSALNYGDFYSYSLPVLAYLYDQHYGGGVGPGNPYYIKSSPGQISSDIVVATGASGMPVNINFSGMNDAYPTPNSPGISVFSTSTTPDPSFSPPMPANNPDTWDTTISAFMNQMGGEAPFFFFNHNQENSKGSLNQDLWVYAQIKLWSSAALTSPLYYDLVSHNGDGSGQLGGNPGSYTSPTYTNPGWEPVPFQDYVFSQGEVCLDASDQFVSCSDVSAVSLQFNQNLGANQAAYVAYAPEMNDFLSAWDSSSLYDMMSIDLRMHSLNNGFEQVFVLPGHVEPILAPEPSSILFILLGMAGVLLAARKKNEIEPFNGI